MTDKGPFIIGCREFTCPDCGALCASFAPPANDNDLCLICAFIRQQPKNERASLRKLLHQPYLGS